MKSYFIPIGWPRWWAASLALPSVWSSCHCYSPLPSCSPSICWQHFSRVGAPPLRIPSTASRTSKNLINFLNTYWHPTLILYKLLILSMLYLCYILYTDTLTDTILTRIAYLLSLNAILLATILPLLHDYCFEYTFLLLYLLPTSTHS